MATSMRVPSCEKPAEAREVGAEQRCKFRRRGFEEAAQLRIVDVRKIELAGLTGDLPFVALRQPPR